MKKRNWIPAVVGVVLAALSVSSGLAQTFPSRPVRVMVPYAAGGSTDLLARLVAQHMSEQLGQQVLVVNKPGGATMPGAEEIARAEPDGYSLLLGTTATGSNTVLYKTVPYKLDSFASVAALAVTPNVIVVNAGLPVKSVPEFIAYAKARPGQLNYASLGRGGLTHLVSERFLALADLKIVEVNFTGAGPGQIALAGNEVQVFFDSIPASMAMHQAGKTRILAVTSEQRLPSIPEIPTFAELGYPEMTKGGWYGFLAPAGTPAPVRDRLRAAIESAQKLPLIQQRLGELGAQPLVMSGAAFDDFIRKDAAYWGDIAKRLNITLDN